jgi:hypothetical protein
MLKNPGTILIVILIVAVAVAIGAYQLVINKYYWGPKGPPKDVERDKQQLER